MNASLLFLALDVATIVCSALLGARFLMAKPKQLTAQLIALITFNSICHVVLSRYEYRYWIPAPYHFEVGAWAPALNLARNLTPGLFMVLCFEMFADRSRFPRSLLGLFVVQMVLEAPAHWVLAAGSPIAQVLTRIAPAILQTVFAGFALYWTVGNWRVDLIENRRRSRAVVVFIIGLNIIGQSLLLRVVIDQNTIANYNAHLAFVVVNLPVILFILLRLSDDEIRELLQPGKLGGTVAAARPAPPAETAAALARLRTLMDVERAYRKPDLSLKGLADLVQLPEYRLRKIIHEELGYQNFNAFLHDYRVKDACRQLRDPKMLRTPILTIALTTGYQSINTFNRGFREVMGMTPSAYRAQEDASQPPGKPSPESA